MRKDILIWSHRDSLAWLYLHLFMGWGRTWFVDKDVTIELLK